MAQIAAYADVTEDKIVRRRGTDPDHPSADVYPFIGMPRYADGGPNAYLVRYVPGTSSSAHYHAADQMQVIVEGKGTIGSHFLTPYQIHFARAYTPYGPLVPDANEGWAFVNLRARPDPGGQRLSQARDKLLQVPNRRPFQINCPVVFPQLDVSGPTVLPIEGLHNAEGLDGLALTLPPGGRYTAPSAAGSDGQYVLVVEGSLIAQGVERDAIAVVHINPDEPAFEVQAGAKGLRAMIVNFPRMVADAVQASAPAAASKLWHCVLCDFVYDEAAGIPDEGIAPGTRWQDVPANWTCPDCGVSKADFEMVEF